MSFVSVMLESMHEVKLNQKKKKACGSEVNVILELTNCSGLVR